jgi:hypothetical protein
MIQKGSMVDIHVPTILNLQATYGRVQELVPPNCAKVYVIPQSRYELLKLEHLTERVEVKPKAAEPSPKAPTPTPTSIPQKDNT